MPRFQIRGLLFTDRMTLVFKYNVLPDEFTNDTKKPIVKLTLHGNNQTPIDVIALLDSGADVSVIPKGLAEYLELKFGKKDISKGIGGEISIWNSSMNVGIKGIHENYTFRNIPVQIAENDKIPIILGRAGFFQKFMITIDEKKKRVKLKRVND